MMDNRVQNNKENKRFEIALDNGDFAILDYSWRGNNLALTHTFVPPDYEGNGYAAALSKAALEYAKTEGTKVLPYCPYVSAYIKKHPQYDGIVAQSGDQ